MLINIQNTSSATDDNSTAEVVPGLRLYKGQRTQVKWTYPQFMAAKTGLDALVTAGKIKYSFARITPFDCGAYGNGVQDDTAAFTLAASLLNTYGGLFYMERPSSCYRVTGRTVFGNRWVAESDVKYVSGGTWDPRAQASYNSSLYNGAITLPVISIEGEPGTEIFGDFAPGTETAIFVYGVACAQTPGAQSAYIKNLTFVGPTGYSSGTAAFPSGATSITTNVSGLCVLGSSVKVEGCGARELNRGFIGFENYWGEWDHLRALHCVTGFDLQGANAMHAGRLRAEYCQNTGLVATGQGWTVDGYYTEQCAVDFYVPACDRGTIMNTYLEAAGAGFTDYHGKIGDPSAASTVQVVGLTLKNVHGSRDYGRHLKLHSAQVVAEGCRLYQTNANSLTLLNNVYSSLMKQDSDLPIDPAGFPDRAFRRGTASHVDSFGITQSQGDQTNGGDPRKNTTGLTLGIQHVWHDATHGMLRTKQGAPSDQHDGKAITAISTQQSTTGFGSLAAGATAEISSTALPNIVAGDYVEATYRPSGVAWVAGLILQARCDVSGTVKVTLTNTTGSTFNGANTNFGYRLTYWSNLG